MKNILVPITAALAIAASGAWAKAPADATGECKDGTYTTSATKEGACSSHGGVKKWLAKPAKEEKKSKADKAEKKSKADKESTAKSPKPDDKAAASAPAKSSTASTPAAAPSGSSSKAASANTAASSRQTTPAAQRAAATGGGAGKVWVNTDSKVYHCEKDAMYGKTKQGEYMTESQAKASGARPSRGKECS